MILAANTRNWSTRASNSSTRILNTYVLVRILDEGKTFHRNAVDKLSRLISFHFTFTLVNRRLKVMKHCPSPMKYFFIPLMILLAFASSAPATTYYVDNSCSINGNGQGQSCPSSPGGLGPFNSLANAQSAVRGNHSDNRLLFKRGQTFAGQFTVRGLWHRGTPVHHRGLWNWCRSHNFFRSLLISISMLRTT